MDGISFFFNLVDVCVLVSIVQFELCSMNNISYVVWTKKHVRKRVWTIKLNSLNVIPKYGHKLLFHGGRMAEFVAEVGKMNWTQQKITTECRIPSLNFVLCRCSKIKIQSKTIEWITIIIIIIIITCTSIIHRYLKLFKVLLLFDQKNDEL